MEFILKSRAFLLELFDYGINECVCHEKHFNTCKSGIKVVRAGGTGWRVQIPVIGRNPALGRAFRPHLCLTLDVDRRAKYGGDGEVRFRRWLAGAGSLFTS